LSLNICLVDRKNKFIFMTNFTALIKDGVKLNNWNDNYHNN